jgi:hypothetical protein
MTSQNQSFSKPDEEVAALLAVGYLRQLVKAKAEEPSPHGMSNHSPNWVNNPLAIPILQSDESETLDGVIDSHERGSCV